MGYQVQVYSCLIILKGGNIFYKVHNSISTNVCASGGGQYDEECNGIKIGIWIELDKKFDIWTQITYSGGYKNCKKVDRFDTLYDNQNIVQFCCVCFSDGGSQDEEINGINIEKWIELDEGFLSWKQVDYKSEYQNGQKIGTCVEMKRVKDKIEEGFKKIKK